MRMTVLPRTDLRVSKFIFGTASLLNVGASRQRQRLLYAAVDAGFTHFDTSPYYGFGVAERDLAGILRATPQLTFTTKAGLYPAGGADQPVGMVLLRKILGRGVRSLSAPVVDLTVGAARRSLDASLRRTGRERVDLYLLHDATACLVDTHEWMAWLDSCVVGGKVGAFGMTCTYENALGFLAAGKQIGSVLQLRDSLMGREADVVERFGVPKQITYGYVSAALRGGHRTSIVDILSRALERNRDGSIIVATRRLDRLKQYAAITEPWSDDRRP